MTPALLLIDLQNDYLQTHALQPALGDLVDRCAAALDAARNEHIPILHVRTTIRDWDTEAMPHWRAAGVRKCMADTPGHEPPIALAARADEPVIHKTHYSAFQDPTLLRVLEERNADTIVVAGVHSHACVRSTVLDAYRFGRQVVLLDDALGSNDPLHDAMTRRYLGERGCRRLSTDAFIAGLEGGRLRIPQSSLDHHAPHDGRHLFTVPLSGASDAKAAVDAARAAFQSWRHVSVRERIAWLRASAERLEEVGDDLANGIVTDVGKPVSEAKGEVARSVALLRAVADRLDASESNESGSRWRRRPLGVVAMITPWNNPLAIPVGKLAGAIGYGNAVVWKPAVPGTRVATRFLSALEGHVPEGLVTLLTGDADTGLILMRTDGIDAVTLSGSSRAGYAAQDVCASRRVPLQAELGGNNAALIWRDADVDAACRAVVRGAFGFAGQRCTANRRVVVDASVREPVLAAIRHLVDSLAWGDPTEADVIMGPVISRSKRASVESLLDRCAGDGLVVERRGTCRISTPEAGAYVSPAIVVDPPVSHEIVQHETFGPVLVVQTAANWAEAMSLVNGVSQGLVAALFSASAEKRRAFVDAAEAGIVKLNQGTDGASVELPFGGWKASGVGPPEHGPGNEAFYTRFQSVYEE